MKVQSFFDDHSRKESLMAGELRKIEDFEVYSIFEYTPNLLHLFGKYYPERINLRRIIRFTLALKDGYKIYSLVKDNKALAYCTIQSGKSSRFDYTTENDIVVRPYVVMPDFQGDGLAAKLIKRILVYKAGQYRYAYAYITDTNIASIKTCERLGFRFYKNAYVTAFKADVKATDDDKTGHVIMRLKGEEFICE